MVVMLHCAGEFADRGILIKVAGKLSTQSQ